MPLNKQNKAQKIIQTWALKVVSEERLNVSEVGKLAQTEEVTVDIFSFVFFTLTDSEKDQMRIYWKYLHQNTIVKLLQKKFIQQLSFN